MILVSVIIPAYQAEKTIRRAIQSVLNTPRRKEIEVIVVDDCSNDNTCNVVRSLQQDNTNIKLFVMSENSGSPSGPRNLGFEKAGGLFITNLDADDTFDASRLLDMADESLLMDYVLVKGYLIVKEGEKTREENRLPIIPKPGTDTKKLMVEFQSMTQDYLVRRDFINKHGFCYDTSLKIGEDTKLLTEMLAKTDKVAYIDNYYLIYSKTPIRLAKLSSTQQWGDKEINDQIRAWECAKQNLKRISINFYEYRLPAGLRNILVNIVGYSNGISRECFTQFSNFVNRTQKYTKGKMNLHPRYEALYQAILLGDYDNYCKISKRRLLIAGYDLKFILPIVPFLNNWYEVSIDEWKGHNTHNYDESLKYAQWADIIWCEWMLGNAVFYCQHKHKYQRLVIRAHRFEIMREFGEQIDFEKVDAVFTVGYYYLELFTSTFSIPRTKMRLLSNYVDKSVYQESFDYKKHNNDKFRFRIGMAGIIPSRKGFLRGLSILNTLVKKDDNYRLVIKGKIPWEESFILNDIGECDYYKECDRYILEQNLNDFLEYRGYVNREELYTDIGYILSLSDSQQFPESFHLAPAEAASAGCMSLILNFPGAEYIYPNSVIFNTLDEITDELLRAKKDDIRKFHSESFNNYIEENYGLDHFLTMTKDYLDQVRILG